MGQITQYRYYCFVHIKNWGWCLSGTGVSPVISWARRPYHFMNVHMLGQMVSNMSLATVQGIRERAIEARRKCRRRLNRQRLLGMELLEDRRVYAGFSLVGSTLQIQLATNEAMGITSSGASYEFALASGSWTGSDASGLIGNGLPTLTATAALVTTVNVDDVGAGDAVSFADSGINPYSSSFFITLDNVAAGPIAFNGLTSFAGGSALNASTSMNIVVNAGSMVTSVNGNILLFRS